MGGTFNNFLSWLDVCLQHIKDASFVKAESASCGSSLAMAESSSHQNNCLVYSLVIRGKVAIPYMSIALGSPCLVPSAPSRFAICSIDGDL